MKKTILHLVIICILNSLQTPRLLSADVLVATGSDIKRYSSDGTLIDTFVNSASYGMFYDEGGQTLYFTSPDDSIKSVPRAGGSVSTLVSSAGNIVADVVVDRTNSKLIWTAYSDGEINRAPLSGGSKENIVSGLFYPHGIIIDSTNSKIYWAEYGKIQRADLDGTNVTQVASDGSSELTFLKIVDNELYWTNLTEGALKKINLNTSIVTTVAQSSATTKIEGIDYDTSLERWYYIGFPTGGIGLSTMTISGGSQSEINSSAKGYDIIADYSTSDPTPTPTPTPTSTPYPDLKNRLIYSSVSGSNPRIFYFSLNDPVEHEILGSSEIDGPTAMTLAGNYIYFADVTPTQVSLRKVKYDGTELTTLYGTTPFNSYVDKVTSLFVKDSRYVYMYIQYNTSSGCSGDKCVRQLVYDTETETTSGTFLETTHPLVPGFGAYPTSFPYNMATTTSVELYKNTELSEATRSFDVKSFENISSIGFLHFFLLPFCFTGHVDGTIAFCHLLGGSGLYYQTKHSRQSPITAIAIEVDDRDPYDRFPYMGYFASEINNKGVIGVFPPYPNQNYNMLILPLGTGDKVEWLTVSGRYGEKAVASPVPTTTPTTTNISGSVNNGGTLSSAAIPFNVLASNSLKDIPVYLQPYQEDTTSSSFGSEEDSSDNTISDQVTFTDASGYFSFTNIPEGDYLITLKREDLGIIPTSFRVTTGETSPSITAYENKVSFKGCRAKSFVGLLKKLTKKGQSLTNIGITKSGKSSKSPVKLKGDIKTKNASLVTASLKLPTYGLICKRKQKTCTKVNHKKNIKSYNKALKSLASKVKKLVTGNDKLANKVNKIHEGMQVLVKKLPNTTYNCQEAEE